MPYRVLTNLGAKGEHGLFLDAPSSSAVMQSETENVAIDRLLMLFGSIP